MQMDKPVHEDRLVAWRDSCKLGRFVYFAFGGDFNYEKDWKILSSSSGYNNPSRRKSATTPAVDGLRSMV
jgi:hypothetical protein